MAHPDDPGAPTVREAVSSDLLPVRKMLTALLGDHLLSEPLLELVDAAIRSPDDERACLVVTTGPRISGAAVIGMIAGAERAGRLQLLVCPGDERAAAALVHATDRVLTERGARLIVAELPRIEALEETGRLLRGLGYEESGRIAAYFREGVDLVILRRAITY